MVCSSFALFLLFWLFCFVVVGRAFYAVLCVVSFQLTIFMYTNSSSTLLCLTFTPMAFSASNENQIIKEKLKLCYLREGVNHLENCSELATAYMDSLRGTGIYKIHNAHHARDVVKVRRKPQTLSYQLHHCHHKN